MHFGKSLKNFAMLEEVSLVFFTRRLSIHVMSLSDLNWLFASWLLPLYQNESKCEAIHMKMRLAYRLIFMKIQNSF